MEWTNRISQMSYIPNTLATPTVNVIRTIWVRWNMQDSHDFRIYAGTKCSIWFKISINKRYCQTNIHHKMDHPWYAHIYTDKQIFFDIQCKFNYDDILKYPCFANLLLILLPLLLPQQLQLKILENFQCDSERSASKKVTTKASVNEKKK